VTNAVGSPRYLGADKAITYTPSLALFAQSRADAPPLGESRQAYAVVVGNPVFNHKPVEMTSAKVHAANSAIQIQDGKPVTRETRHYAGERSALFIEGQPPDPLPETKVEAMEIARLYKGDLLTEERATEAALRDRVGRADVIHLATHGYFNPVRAMSSGVLLSAPERELVDETVSDGVLQAWEIYSQLKLKAELVVLSACESGRGQNVRGEGIVGLTRALQYAGARSIVATQWKVSDKSTSALMVAFHRLLRQGVAKDEALRQAMAVVRQHRATAHPYYWAGFFLIGDPDNPT
jgi:CHAT domain-containing protein